MNKLSFTFYNKFVKEVFISFFLLIDLLFLGFLAYILLRIESYDINTYILLLLFAYTLYMLTAYHIYFFKSKKVLFDNNWIYFERKTGHTIPIKVEHIKSIKRIHYCYYRINLEREKTGLKKIIFLLPPNPPLSAPSQVKLLRKIVDKRKKDIENRAQ